MSVANRGNEVTGSGESGANARRSPEGESRFLCLLCFFVLQINVCIDRLLDNNQGLKKGSAVAVVKTRTFVQEKSKKNFKAIYIGNTLAWEFRSEWAYLVDTAKAFGLKFSPTKKMWEIRTMSAGQELAKYLRDNGERENLVCRDFKTGIEMDTDTFIEHGSLSEKKAAEITKQKQSLDLSVSVEGRNVYVTTAVDSRGRPVPDHAHICGLAYIGCEGEWIDGKGYKLKKDSLEALDFIVRDNASGGKTPIRGVPKLLETPFIVDVYDDVLFPHQRIGVKFLANRPRAILADDMGLGKSLQSIVAAEQIKADGEADVLLIICPVSLMGNWENELKKWESSYERVYIIPYSRFKKIDEMLKAEKGRKIVAIVDEAHYLKNPSSQRTKNFTELFMYNENMFLAIWLLTGTPVTKDYSDIWPLAQIIDHPAHTMYRPSQLTEMGGDVLGTHVLSGSLKTRMMIRKKTDTLDLPAKITQVVENKTDLAKLVNKDVLSILAHGETALAMEHLMRLKRLTAVAKADATIEKAKSILSEGRKVVIFSDHTQVIDRIEQELSEHGVVRISGKTKNRTEIVERFQTDDATKVFVGQIKAAGVGITLTAASDVIISDFSWLPSDIQQAEDRCHRIGIKGTVNVYYMADSSMILDKILLEKLANRSAEIATFEGSQQSIMSDIRDWAKKQVA